MADSCPVAELEDPDVEIHLTKRQLRVLYDLLDRESKCVEAAHAVAVKTGDTIAALQTETRLCDLESITETCFFDTFLADDDSDV